MKRVAIGCLVIVLALGALFGILIFYGASEGKKNIEPILADLHAKRFDAVIDRYHSDLTDQVPRAQWKEWYAGIFASVGEAKSYELGSWNTNAQAVTSPSKDAPLGSGTYISGKATVEHERGKAEHEFTLFKPSGGNVTFVSKHKFRTIPNK